jgi:hypothetical protein
MGREDEMEFMSKILYFTVPLETVFDFATGVFFS